MSALLVIVVHGRIHGVIDRATRAEGQQLVGVHRLGDVVRRAGFQTLLAVALHRLGRQREDRQRPERGFRRISRIVS